MNINNINLKIKIALKKKNFIINNRFKKNNLLNNQITSHIIKKKKIFFYDNKYLYFQQNIIPKINLDIGFIILRHINSVLTNTYWIRCYNSIRKYYPENKILIIDDNSNLNYLTEINLYKTQIIKSEYHGSGELLPYIYYLRNKLFNKAVILHDSVFINKYIDFNVQDYKLLWSFYEPKDTQYDPFIRSIFKVYKNPKLMYFYNKKLWQGCFGGMTIITYDYLSFVNNKYNLNKLIPYITNRKMRMCFERILGCLLQMNKPYKCLLDNIKNYCPWGIKINKIYDEEIKNYLL